MVLANILIIISYHLTLGKQKFLHRMGAQEVTSQKALDNSWVQEFLLTQGDLGTGCPMAKI